MRSARVRTHVRAQMYMQGNSCLNTNRKGSGKFGTQVGFHAGWRLNGHFKAFFSRGGGLHKNRTERETEIMKLESVWRLITGTGCPRFRVYFDDTKGGKSLWVDVVPHVCSLLRPTCCRCLQLNVRFFVGPFLLFGGNKQVLFFFSSTTSLVSSAGFMANLLCTRSCVYRV